MTGPQGAAVHANHLQFSLLCRYEPCDCCCEWMCRDPECSDSWKKGLQIESKIFVFQATNTSCGLGVFLVLINCLFSWMWILKILLVLVLCLKYGSAFIADCIRLFCTLTTSFLYVDSDQSEHVHDLCVCVEGRIGYHLS